MEMRHTFAEISWRLANSPELATGVASARFLRRRQEQVLDAARKIGLFLWIDAQKRTCQHVSVNGAAHQATALDLLGLTCGRVDPITPTGQRRANTTNAVYQRITARPSGLCQLMNGCGKRRRHHEGGQGDGNKKTPK
jgi:hypothetical protein